MIIQYLDIETFAKSGKLEMQTNYHVRKLYAINLPPSTYLWLQTLSYDRNCHGIRYK